MNKELNHDQISSVDQIDQFKWTVRVLEGGKFGQSFKKTFKHGGKFGQSFGPGPGFRFGLRSILQGVFKTRNILKIATGGVVRGVIQKEMCNSKKGV